MYDLASLPTLAIGEFGDWVTHLQETLATLGYLHTMADGTYGDDTHAAVVAFQTEVGLPTTGIMDTETWHALQARAAYYAGHAAHETHPGGAAHPEEHTKSSHHGSPVTSAEAAVEIAVEFPTSVVDQFGFWQLGGKAALKVHAKGEGGEGGLGVGITRSYTYNVEKGTFEEETTSSLELVDMTIADFLGTKLKLSVSRSSNKKGATWSAKLVLGGAGWSGAIGLNSDLDELFGITASVDLKHSLALPFGDLHAEAGSEVELELALGLTDAGKAFYGAWLAEIGVEAGFAALEAGAVVIEAVGGVGAAVVVGTAGLTLAAVAAMSEILGSVHEEGRRQDVGNTWAEAYAGAMAHSYFAFDIPEAGGDWESRLRSSLAEHPDTHPDWDEVRAAGRAAAANDLQPYNDHDRSELTGALRGRFGATVTDSEPTMKDTIWWHMVAEVKQGANPAQLAGTRH